MRRREYRAASWRPPSRVRSSGLPRWHRKFLCPACGTVAGKQWIEPRLDPAQGYVVIGYRIVRVELPYLVQPRPPLTDGTLSFGLATRAKSARQRSPVHRYAPVLASVGDPNWVARDDPHRLREHTGFWVLALSGEDASRPFVVTCHRAGCGTRMLVDNPPTVEVMATAHDSRGGSAVLGS